jgi:hypothetical protein
MMALIDDPAYYRCHTMLHRLWTKGHGNPDYVKEKWQALEQAIELLARPDSQGAEERLDRDIERLLKR